MNKRYFFDQDDDCHWYLVLEKERDAWEKWKKFPLRSAPKKIAIPLESHPKHVTFEQPYERGAM